MTRDVLKDKWACMACNSTFEMGEMRCPKLVGDPLHCPRCDSVNVHPADGAIRDVPDYVGEVGTKN